ncbi:hypothetical protein QYE76_003544 [Lolium multiflorum]|uniref:Protein LURP-one-related 5-like n=1 Tax=Lolium multiflorum TaxID=4521 RepID=A0AAD8RQF3_LOLMU|nr:hypothetical protein QYE76_003544 [Lolium multiflorum]
MCPLLPGTSRQTNMSRIHPSDRRGDHGARRAASAARSGHEQPAVYTVWKRSSMGFQGTDGFSVYDAAGRLAFRVDNYARRPKAFAGELLLMDGRGAPLLSLRPQILSLHDRWNCYRVAPEEGCPDNTDGGSSGPAQQLFSMRKCAALQSTDDAEVYLSSASTATTSGRGCRAHPPPPRLPCGGLLLQEELQDHRERRPRGGADMQEEIRRVVYGGVQAGLARRRRVQPGRSAGRGRRDGHGYRCRHGPDLPEAVRADGLLCAVVSNTSSSQHLHQSREFFVLRWMDPRTAAHRRRPLHQDIADVRELFFRVSVLVSFRQLYRL